MTSPKRILLLVTRPAEVHEAPYGSNGNGSPMDLRPLVYLAGPMSNKPAYNVEEFERVAALLEQRGWRVVTPFEANDRVWYKHFGRHFDPYNDKCEWDDKLMPEMFVADMEELARADAVAVMDGWERSLGAAPEALMAQRLKKPVFHAITGQDIPFIDVLIPSDTGIATPQQDLRRAATEGLTGAGKSEWKKAPEKPTETALQEAQRLVYGDRQGAYGHPFDDYTRTGRKWGSTLDGWLRKQPGFENIPPVPDVDPRIACLMMAEVKASREVNSPKRDNRVDLAGYAECVNRIAERQEELAAALVEVKA